MKEISTNMPLNSDEDSPSNHKRLLIDFYLEIKNEIKGEVSLNEELSKLSFENILNYIRESINILIGIKVSERLSAQYNTSEHQYEELIRQLEADVRALYQRESQLLIVNQSLEEKIRGLIVDSKDNSCNAHTFNGSPNRKDKDYLILQAENSNLKATIAKYESIIQYTDQKEREMNEDFDKEKSALTITIASLEKRLMSSNVHHHKSIHSNSNINININDLRDSNYVIKTKGGGKLHQSEHKNSSNLISHTQNPSSKTKKVEVIISRRTPINSSRKERRIQSLKGKSSIQSKENSMEIDDDLVASPVMKKYHSKSKYKSKLSGSYSKKDNFISTYNKVMNMHSPNKTMTNVNSAYQSQQSPSKKEQKPRLMPSYKEKRSSSKSVKAITARTSLPSSNLQPGKNPTINLFSEKTVTSFNAFKSPLNRDKRYFRASTSRARRKTINTVIKK